MTNASLFLFGLAMAGLVALVAILEVRRRFVARSGEAAEADRRFESTFEQAAVGIAHLDADGRWIRINRRFCEITGYDQDELMQKTVDDITHPLDRSADSAARGAMVDGEVEHSRVEKRYIRKDGKIVWVNATRSAVRDASGRPEFFVAVVEEITARKEAEARLTTGEAQYRAIFDSAVEAMAVIDAEGTIQSVNPSVERIFGYPPEEMAGRNIKMLMPDSIGSHHDGFLSHYRDTGKKAIIGIGREVIGQRRDGTVFPLDLSVAEWKRDGVTFFTGVMRDVSARKDAETALRASEESLRLLQSEFAHLARVNDLGEMAAAISHEINQPLTAIVNLLNSGLFIAKAGYSEDGFVETAQLMDHASQQALRAGDIVRRLREFVGHGDIVRTVESVGQIVDAAMALALIDARTLGIVVERVPIAGTAWVEIDAIQIQQVMVNLLRNAVDALSTSPPADEAPQLTVTTAAAADGMIEFIVADNGPGIDDDLKDHLFEPFVTTKSQGMGMGLSVSRRLIESHGGTIGVESSPGAGAAFKFRLPRYRPN
jgi:two-component system sensor kinase FixL